MLDIGSRVEPLVDDTLMDTSRNITLKLHPPCPQELVMRFNKPWEGGVAAMSPCSRMVALFGCTTAAAGRPEMMSVR